MLKHHKFTKNISNVMCKLIGHKWELENINDSSINRLCKRCGFSKKMFLKDFATMLLDGAKKNEKLRKAIYG